jgi:hypothetical protein
MAMYRGGISVDFRHLVVAVDSVKLGTRPSLSLKYATFD